MQEVVGGLAGVVVADKEHEGAPDGVEDRLDVPAHIDQHHAEPDPAPQPPTVTDTQRHAPPSFCLGTAVARAPDAMHPNMCYCGTVDGNWLFSKELFCPKAANPEQGRVTPTNKNGPC